MNCDFKVSTGFLTHPKTLVLIQELGGDGVVGLLGLWAFAAKERISGDLRGLNNIILERTAGWTGEPGRLVLTLKAIGFLDGAQSDYRLHNWVKWNEYASRATWRIERARKGGNTKARQTPQLRVVTPTPLDQDQDKGSV